MRNPLIAGLAGIALAALSEIPQSASAAPVMADTTLHVTAVATGLNSPTTMAFLGRGDILVCEKTTGRVLHVVNGIIQAVPALDVGVNFASERGMLGIALHPDFPATPWVYLYFTPSSTGGDTSNSNQVVDNRIVRYTWTGSALTTPVIIQRLEVTPGPNHDGGILLFGPDRKLYAVIGELNRNGKLQNYPSGPAPDTTGVIMRMNDDGTAPADNPFAGVSRMELLYSYGLRNCFGMTFDPLTGDLWNTEPGPNSYDEINRVTPGMNGGWEQIVGPDARSSKGIADLWMAAGASYSDPEFSWAQVVTPTPILFLHTDRYGSTLRDRCIVGDNNFGRLYQFTLAAARDSFVFSDPLLADRVADNNTTETASILWGQGFGAVTDFDLDPDGILHIVDLTGGTIWRVDNTAVTASPAPSHAADGLRVLPAGASGRVLRWTQPGTGGARVVLADLQGRRLRDWSAPATGAAGERVLRWDGRDDRGRLLARGVYRLTVHAEGSSATRLQLWVP